MGPRVERMSDGGLRLANLAPWFVGVLLELPDLLDSDQPEAVSRRLYPEPSEDQDQQEDWDKYVRPELFALIASARRIVVRDIGGMGPGEEDPGMPLWILDIPENHIQAWISALNVARLTLSEKHGVGEAEMTAIEEDEFDPDSDEWSEKRFAVARIHLLGYLQQMLIEQESPPPEGFEGPR